MFWMPADTDLDKTKLVIAVQNGANNNSNIGVAQMKFSDDFILKMEQGRDYQQVAPKNVPLFGSTGRARKSVLDAVVVIGPRDLALDDDEAFLYEYQRKNITGWGSTPSLIGGDRKEDDGMPHFILTDREKRYGTIDGSKYSHEFSDIASTMPAPPAASKS